MPLPTTVHTKALDALLMELYGLSKERLKDLRWNKVHIY